MSASLVGSEMCIRDRYLAAKQLEEDLPGERRGPEPVLVELGREHQRVAAVSYTHLTLPTICSV
eukprot:4491248-Alexandrium_andersonii.AAC.1